MICVPITLLGHVYYDHMILLVFGVKHMFPCIGKLGQISIFIGL